MTMHVHATPAWWASWAGARGAQVDEGDPCVAWLEDAAGTTWMLAAATGLLGAELAAWRDAALLGWGSQALAAAPLSIAA